MGAPGMYDVIRSRSRSTRRTNLERQLRVRDAILDYFAKHDPTSAVQLKVDDWQIMAEIVGILLPLRIASNRVQARDATMSDLA